jgi:hypothetical protein
MTKILLSHWRQPWRRVSLQPRIGGLARPPATSPAHIVMTLWSFQGTRTSESLICQRSTSRSGAVVGGDLLLPRFAARAGHGRPCCSTLGARTRAMPTIVEQTNARRRRDVGLTCRGSVGRNLGDDLANRRPEDSPTPTSTNTAIRRYSQRCRPHTEADLVDTKVRSVDSNDDSNRAARAPATTPRITRSTS